MNFGLWTLRLAAFSLAFVACSSDHAGTSVETENSIAVLVRGDGAPLALSRVRVRPSDYLPGTIPESLAQNDSVVGIWNAETDSLGQLNLPRFGEGKYTLEAMSGSLKGFEEFSIAASDSGEISVEVSAKPVGSISGIVHGVDPRSFFDALYAGVRGMEYAASVSSDGTFRLDSLPAADVVVEIYGLARDEQGVVVISAGTQNVKVRESQNAKVEFGKKPAPAPKPEPDPGSAKDSVVEPAYPKYLLSDFEEGVWGWYRSSSIYSTAKLTSDDAGVGRRGKVAHFEYSNDSAYNWTLMGTALGGVYDFSALDSVTFWARGNGSVFLSFDKYIDSTDRGKSWVELELDSLWTHFAVTPADLLPADKNGSGGNVGWEAVKESITNINFFGNFGSEFWLDDVEIYGVKSLL